MVVGFLIVVAALWIVAAWWALRWALHADRGERRIRSLARELDHELEAFLRVPSPSREAGEGPRPRHGA